MRRSRAARRGLGHIPEDRQRRGLVLDFSLAENLALHDYRYRAGLPLRLAPRASLVARAASCSRSSTSAGVVPRRRPRSSPAGTSRSSSSRARSTRPEVLIAAQPTRGLDVGAIEFIHRRLVEERDEGRGILLVSLELEEILSLSDRILVMYEGEIVGEFPPTSARRRSGSR